MVGMNGNGIGNAYGVYNPKNDVAKAEESKNTDYGKTIGEPKLSDEAKKYYEQLKKKFGNYDFILVSADEKENAKANAAKYANSIKTVVLIDEEKIEKMATDKNYRQKYEGVLSGATAQLEQLKSSMTQTGAKVKGYGMQVNDDGATSFFAVLKRSSADQKARIEKKAAQKRAEKKAAQKKAEKEAAQERIKKPHSDKELGIESDEEEVISASSMEELLKRLEEYSFNERSNRVMTNQEQLIGQHIDFRG